MISQNSPGDFLGTVPSGETTKGIFGENQKGLAKRPAASSLAIFASTTVGFCITDKRFLTCKDSRIP